VRIRLILVWVIALSALVLMGAHGIQTTATLQMHDAAAMGLSGSLFAVNKFGFNDDLDGTEESIWDVDDLPTSGDGPLRCFANMTDVCHDPADPEVQVDCGDQDATAGLSLRVSSDSVADAGLPISVEFIDSNYRKRVVVSSLGVAAATTGTVYEVIDSGFAHLRVNRAFATGTAFTGNVFIHIDSVDTGTDGIPDIPATQLIAGITAGENQTLQACYTVPLGHFAALTQFCSSNASAAGSVRFRLRRSIAGEAPRTSELYPQGNNVYSCTVHTPPAIFEEKTDIELTGVGAAVNNDASGTFDLILLPNTMR
jgi:hypothetical protein